MGYAGDDASARPAFYQDRRDKIHEIYVKMRGKDERSLAIHN